MDLKKEAGMALCDILRDSGKLGPSNTRCTGTHGTLNCFPVRLSLIVRDSSDDDGVS